MIIILCIFLLCLLPQCAYQEQQESIKTLNSQTRRRTKASLYWDTQATTQAEEKMSLGITQQEAVAIALEHNAQLQAALETIGIASSDLKQAGFYTNPRIETLVKLPLKATDPNVEVNASFTISDLWQVPLRKKVAQDELEIQTMAVLQLILDTTLEAQLHYIDCMYYQKRMTLINSITLAITELYNRIVYRKSFGYSTDLDIHFAKVTLTQWQAMYAQAQADLQAAYTMLRRTLGINVSDSPVACTDSLKKPSPLPAKKVLIDYALYNRPEMQIAQLKKLQSQRTISLEYARIFDNVKAGIVWERDFEGERGVGPSFGIDIPIFNPNTGNIDRAKYQLAQAEKEIVTTKQHILQQIYFFSAHYEANLEQAALYTNQAIPASKAAIEYAEHYTHTMQLNMLVLINTYTNLYEVNLKEFDYLRLVNQNRAHIEREISSSLDTLQIS